MGIQFGLFVALLAGMVFSAWQGGKLQISWGRISEWLSYLFGGTLMGIGAAIQPGGNDALLLSGMTMLSPHAL